MSAKPKSHSSLEIVDEASTWLVGGGIVTMALFPLALPAIALLAIAALPLLLVPLVGAAVAGLIVLPLRLARRALRALRRTPDRHVTDRMVIARSAVP
jgi:membrane protein implicated in regulation of membrane protease activity